MRSFGLRFSLAAAALASALCVAPPPAVHAQEAPGSGAPAVVALPSGYGSMSLGMSFEEADAALRTDTLYDYRGPSDASLLSEPNQSLIETTGRTFVKRAYFQFYNDKLFSIILVLNPERVDHYTMYTALVEKYGKPAEFSPEAAVWSDGAVRMSLERPLTLKYVDQAVLESLQAESGARKAVEELQQKQFIDGL